MLLLRSGYATDVGRVRERNEDSMLVSGSFFAVADGMGGHAAGEVASSITVQRLRLLADLPVLTPDDVTNALDAANDLILQSVAEAPQQAGMGTTVCGLANVQLGGASHWLVFNVGDSRVYRRSADVLVRLTVDHSEVAERVMAGELTEEQARLHPRRNVVTRSLGTSPSPTADVWMFPVVPTERFVLCSDGLSSEVTDDEIDQILASTIEAQAAADALVTAALSSGGHDNVTVIVVDTQSDGLSEAMATTAPRRSVSGAEI